MAIMRESDQYLCLFGSMQIALLEGQYYSVLFLT